MISPLKESDLEDAVAETTEEGKDVIVMTLTKEGFKNSRKILSSDSEVIYVQGKLSVWNHTRYRMVFENPIPCSIFQWPTVEKMTFEEVCIIEPDPHKHFTNLAISNIGFTPVGLEEPL